MRVLDLFCGAGGAAMGYHLAGYEVVGVDIRPQKNFPFEFHQADATEYPLDGFDLIHASPPCQGYTRMVHLVDSQGTRRSEVKLIEPVRARLRASGIPYVIENVEGAPLVEPVKMCGSMFGLRVRRHRLFESSIDYPCSITCDHKAQGRPVGVWNWGRWGHEIKNGGKSAESLEDAKDAMGIDWKVNRKELTEAIPPAYTQHIGHHLSWALT